MTKSSAEILDEIFKMRAIKEGKTEQEYEHEKLITILKKQQEPRFSDLVRQILNLKE